MKKTCDRDEKLWSCLFPKSKCLSLGRFYWKYKMAEQSLLKDKKKAIVAIPIYKVGINDKEEISLRQCLNILGEFDICLVCPEGLCGFYGDER